MGMAISHAVASGMGGLRTAGDLVARVQMTKALKIGEAKKYVAERLKIAVEDLTDPVVMTEVRQELQIGVLTPLPGDARAIEAKLRMAEIMDLKINCVERFKKKISL